uniref:Uncharacterized protein n=1 Tax=Hucho hucho TaxID=62062 RepID=A0A4W5K2K9_9TELE
MGTPTDCQGLVGGGGSAKDKAMEKSGGGPPPSNWHRKQQQQHPYRKAEKAPDWMQQQSHHHHPQQPQQPQPQQPLPQQPQQHQAVRSRSVECINSVGVDTTDVFRPSLPQGAKAGHSLPHSVNTSPYRDCSLPGPLPNASPLGGRGGAGGGARGGSCSLQRDGQKVARIRHQQHGGPGPDAPAAELNQSNKQNQNRKPEMEMSPYSYSNSGQGQQHHPQQPPVPPWAMRPHHVHPAEEEQQRKAYMESLSGGRQQPQQQPGQGMGLPPHPSPQPQPPPPPAPSQQQQDPQVASQAQEESSAMKSLLKYSTQQQPLLLSQKSPFGGLGSLKSGGPGGGNPGVSCTLQGSKQQQALPTRKGPANDGERSDCGGRGREVGDVAGHGEGEVRQPPVGIAVAVARQREPSCRPVDAHPNNRQGRVHPSMKGTGVTSGPLGSLA